MGMNWFLLLIVVQGKHNTLKAPTGKPNRLAMICHGLDLAFRFSRLDKHRQWLIALSAKYSKHDSVINNGIPPSWAQPSRLL
jgi:hypothetical protein